MANFTSHQQGHGHGAQGQGDQDGAAGGQKKNVGGLLICKDSLLSPSKSRLRHSQTDKIKPTLTIWTWIWIFGIIYIWEWAPLRAEKQCDCTHLKNRKGLQRTWAEHGPRHDERIVCWTGSVERAQLGGQLAGSSSPASSSCSVLSLGSPSPLRVAGRGECRHHVRRRHPAERSRGVPTGSARVARHSHTTCPLPGSPSPYTHSSRQPGFGAWGTRRAVYRPRTPAPRPGAKTTPRRHTACTKQRGPPALRKIKTHARSGWAFAGWQRGARCDLAWWRVRRGGGGRRARLRACQLGGARGERHKRGCRSHTPSQPVRRTEPGRGLEESKVGVQAKHPADGQEAKRAQSG